MSEEDGLTVTQEPDLEYLISENSNLKKKLGDQGNEIGQLRKAVDLTLQQNSARQEVDDFADPLEKDVKGVRQELNSLKQEQRLRDLESKFPGFRELGQDESFVSWAGSTPYRQRLTQQADAMDLDAAEELLTSWEESRQSANQNHQQAATKRNNDLKAASMEKGSAGGGRKNYFSRTELINMRISNPQKYEAMLPEIKAAYLEGRVRK
mgnify:CR=1 FL=1